MKFAAPIYELNEALASATTHDQMRLAIAQFLNETRKVPAGAFDAYREELLHLALENPGEGRNRPRIRAIAEYCRAKIDPGIWVDILATRFLRIEATNTVLISDLRFPREAEMCRTLGIHRVRIEVDPAVQKERLMLRGEPYALETINHPTETALDEYPAFSATVLNNGSLPQFRSELQTLAQKFLALSSPGGRRAQHYERYVT
jgi:hypothetical protein